jgi:hypothetical protein
MLAHSAQFLSSHPSPFGNLATPQWSVTGQRVMRTAWDEEYKKKGGKSMGLFVIMHIFEVPAKNQYEATDELMAARKNNADKVYLKKVLVRDAGIKLPRDTVNVFEPKKPAKWGTIFKRQITGKE